VKNKSYLLAAFLIVLTLSVGVYAYAYTTATETISIAEPTGDIATVNASETQPDWDSILTPPAAGTETLRPTASGDETIIADQFPDSGAHWDKVDEATADGDSTYISTEWYEWEEDLYNIADSIGSGDINYVRVYYVARAEANPSQTTAYVHIKTNGVEYDGSEDTMTTGYATYSYQWSTNPQTSDAWTWAEIDALQIGVGLRRPSPNKWTRVTQVYAEVNYGGGISIQGEVPTGDLFEITEHADYSGDIVVKVYLSNTGNLTKAYHYLNMKLYLEDSVEAGETPNYQLLTLENGVAAFSLEDGGSDNHTLSVIGGGYGLVSNNTSEWSEGWTVTPEFYCEVIQR